MIRFKIEGGTFNFRVAGVFIRDGRVLVHRGSHDEFYALPGGRAEPFEDTGQTLVREIREELNSEIKISRPLWVCEDFYEYGGNKVHELCFYYLCEFAEDAPVQRSGTFRVSEIGGSELDFTWLPLSDAGNAVIYPRFLNRGLLNLPESVTLIADNELGVL